MDKITPAKIMENAEEVSPPASVRVPCPYEHEDGACSVMDELVRTRTINSQAEYDALYEEHHTLNDETAASIREARDGEWETVTLEELHTEFGLDEK